MLEEGSVSTIPSVAQVCREARAVATRTGALRGVQKPTLSFDFDYRLLRDNSCYDTRWSWYDASRDTLDLDSDFWTSPDCDTRHITLVAQHVRADPFEDGFQGCLDKIFDPASFASLKTVSFIVDRILVHRDMDSATQIQTFGIDGGRDCLIDVEELEQIKNLATEREPADFEDLEWRLHSEEEEEEAILRGSDTPPPTWTWDEFQDVLINEWLIARSLPTKPFYFSDDEHSDDSRSEVPPECALALRQMPKFRRVVVLSMPEKGCDGPCK
jgi:hypothetical protein